jgi:hypothetical protein
MGMIQRMVGPGDPNLKYLGHIVVYQAIVDPGEVNWIGAPPESTPGKMRQP